MIPVQTILRLAYLGDWGLGIPNPNPHFVTLTLKFLKIMLFKQLRYRAMRSDIYFVKLKYTKTVQT
jgi:hypothetical protein